jgi:hypothetical protein
MVVYIYYKTAAGNSISSQLGSSSQGNRYGKSRRCGPSITHKITPAGSPSSSQQGGPPCWTRTQAFGVIVLDKLRVNTPPFLVVFSIDKIYVVTRVEGSRQSFIFAKAELWIKGLR